MIYFSYEITLSAVFQSLSWAYKIQFSYPILLNLYPALEELLKYVPPDTSFMICLTVVYRIHDSIYFGTYFVRFLL